MNFLEAVKAMKEGKKISRSPSDWYCKYDYDEGIRVIPVKGIHLALTHITYSDFEATDWQIVVEEKKTLSDDIASIGMDEYLRVPLVKEAIKEYTKRLMNIREHRTLEEDDIIEQEKEIFGKRLVE